MWGFSSAPSPTGLLPRGFVLQRARVCVVAFLKALLEMPFCIGGWKQGNAMGALCIGSFCHERAETVLVRMQPWCWLSTMVLLALAPTAISTSLHNANLVCSKCFVATDIVLTVLGAHCTMAALLTMVHYSRLAPDRAMRRGAQLSDFYFHISNWPWLQRLPHCFGKLDCAIWHKTATDVVTEVVRF